MILAFYYFGFSQGVGFGFTTYSAFADISSRVDFKIPPDKPRWDCRDDLIYTCAFRRRFPPKIFRLQSFVRAELVFRSATKRFVGILGLQQLTGRFIILVVETTDNEVNSLLQKRRNYAYD
jgi:hypothetical protein